ncbi:hypothetical protein RJG79_00780 [Mycoplasmatota bacterium WC44]
MKKKIKLAVLITLVIAIVLFVFKDVHPGSGYMIREGKTLNVTALTGIIEGVMMCIFLIYASTMVYTIFIYPYRPVIRVFGIELSAVLLIFISTMFNVFIMTLLIYLHSAI